jgi:hypothetical protein
MDQTLDEISRNISSPTNTLNKYAMNAKLSLWLFFLVEIFFNCTRNEAQNVAVNQIVTESKAVNTTYANRTVNFSRTDGTYTIDQVQADFGNTVGNWDTRNNTIINNEIRVRIPKNTVASTPKENALDGVGSICTFDIPKGSEYEMSYKIKFDANFKWIRGGKCGLGFRIGKGYTGCVSVDGGDGGSARVTWGNPNKKDNSGTDNPYFSPYMYHFDKTQDCGDSFGLKSIKLEKNKWYTVYMRVKSNTPNNKDGQVEIKIDGVTLINKNDVRWTTVTTDDRLIKRISWETFRGGKEDYWQSSTDDYIYYDDISWKKLAD